LGLVEIEHVALHVLGHTPNGVGKRGGIALDQPAQNVLVEAVVVERIIDGATHVHVAEGRARHVELGHHHAHGLGFQHLGVAAALDAVELVEPPMPWKSSRNRPSTRVLVSFTPRNSISSSHLGPQPLKWSANRWATKPRAGSNWVSL